MVEVNACAYCRVPYAPDEGKWCRCCGAPVILSQSVTPEFLNWIVQDMGRLADDNDRRIRDAIMPPRDPRLVGKDRR